MAKIGYVGNTPDSTSVIVARQIYNVTTSVGVVTFNSTYQPGYVDVYLNGVRLVDVLDYSAADGRTVNLSANALAGDTIEVVAYKAFDITKSPIGIQSGGQVIKLDSVNTLNFVGSGHTFVVNGNTVDVSIAPGFTTADLSSSSLVVSGISTLGNVTAGVVTANQFSGNITGVAATFTGNVTIGGTLNYEDVTNVDSLGIVTARTGVRVLAGGLDVVGVATFNDDVGIGAASPRSALHVVGDLTVTKASNNPAIIFDEHSGSTDPKAQIQMDQTDSDNATLLFFTEGSGTLSERMRISSDGTVGINATSPVATLHVEGSARIGANNTQSLPASYAGGGCYFSWNYIAGSAETDIYNLYDNAPKSFRFAQKTGASTVADVLQIGTSEHVFFVGGAEKMKITSTGGIHFTNGEMIESANVTAGKLSDNTNIDLENGMVHLFTTTETTTSTPNIRVNSSTSLDSVMAIGETITVTIITTAAAAGYSAQLTIDGSAVTENWVGGSAPSGGGSSGVDIYSYTIIKTASATFTVIANYNATS